MSTAVCAAVITKEPYTPRGPQHFEVPDDYDGPAYCSIECSVYAKSLHIYMKLAKVYLSNDVTAEYDGFSIVLAK